MLIKLILTCTVIAVFGLFYADRLSPSDYTAPLDYIVIPLTIISMVALPVFLIIAIWTGVAP